MKIRNLFLRNTSYLLCLFLLFTLPIRAEDESDDQPIDESVKLSLFGELNIDLRNPSFINGCLRTEEGGVITGPKMRIQAQHICYTRSHNKEETINKVEASGDLLMEFGEYVFAGEQLEYDFLTKTGTIYCGRTAAEPWFFGGMAIQLLADGSFYIAEAFITTSENRDNEWEISAEELTLFPDHNLEAENIQIRVFEIPIFWLPTFHMDLDSIFDSPVRYNVKWGGNQGHRFGLVYRLFSWNHLRTDLRLDYRLKRGLGGGLETEYCSPDDKISFQAVNYAARDSSIIHPDQRFRYRFQGVGDALLFDDRISVHLSYDKVSDIDMPTDYDDRGLSLETAGRTELIIRRQEEWWISTLTTHLRINNFQTIKEELPTFATSWHPFELGPTGIVSDMKVKASYLDFSYGNNQLNVHDYTSTRFEFTPLIYRHFLFNHVNITPEIGGELIAYGSSPESSPKYLGLSKLGCNLNTNFSRHYTDCKHVITPYVDYSYYTMPTVSPGDHYIFDIEDGWYRLNMLRFGMTQTLYCKQENECGCPCINRYLYLDLFANTFFDTHTFPDAIPKFYANVTVNPLPTLRYCLQTAWDFMHNEVDHYNLLAEWTISPNAAIGAEYRHRSAWDWRKADHTNYILDSYRSLFELRHSQVSDRRDTLLFHIFYRIHPSWAFEFESRHGWNRFYEPAYNEFEIDLLGTIRSAWNMKLSYQHREDDDRVSVYFSIGVKRPDCGSYNPNCGCMPF